MINFIYKHHPTIETKQVLITIFALKNVGMLTEKKKPVVNVDMVVI